MDKCKDVHMDALYQTFEYAIATKQLSLIIKLNKHKTGMIEGYSNSNWANDCNDRKSTSGSTFFNSGALVSWNSKTQQCTTCLSTEAAYVAMSHCAMIWNSFGIF